MALTPEEIAEMDAIAGVKTPTTIPNASIVAGQKRAAELEARAMAKRASERKENRGVGEKVLDFTGGKEIAQGLGQALTQKKTQKGLDQAQTQGMDIQGELLKRIKEKKARGEDTTKLQDALDDLSLDMETEASLRERTLNPDELTNKQVVGDATQLGTTLATLGGVTGAGASKTIAGKTIPGLTKAVPGVAQKIAGKITGGSVGALRGGAQGVLAGAGQGAVSGVLLGTAAGLQDDLSGKEIAGKALKGGATGLIGGGIVGGLLGVASGVLQGRALRKEVLDQQIFNGDKEPFDVTRLSQQKQKALEIARQQGIDDVDTQFIQSMKPADRVKADKMIQLAEKASVDKRAIERPIDVVGDSMLERVKFIDSKNKLSGKAVDETAKALKGQFVDATPVRERALSLLEDIGVTANADGSPNWSKSIFKKTPELEKKIMKALSDLPAGEIDAYDLHTFKKSIDEVVDYGVGGEGLKGKSASILKAIRNSADEVLDSTFESYNKANIDFKVTKEVLEEAKDLFGKKTGFAKERGGQLLRSVFSNSAQRPRVLKLIEKLDNTSKTYGKKFSDNLVDQALFTEILEDIYGTQATTSLQGQTARAIKGTQKVLAGIRDPLKGIGELTASATEKAIGVSPENKKKILKALLSMTQK